MRDPGSIHDAVAAWRAQYEAIRGRPWNSRAPRRSNLSRRAAACSAVRISRARSSNRSARLPLGPAFRPDDVVDRALAAASRPARRPPFSISPRASFARAGFRAIRGGRADGKTPCAGRAGAAAPVGPRRGLAARPRKAGARTAGGLSPRARQSVQADGRHGGGRVRVSCRTRFRSESRAGARWAFPATDAGADYCTWLQRFHEVLQPKTYLEIGVSRGASLSLAGPPTRAIGVDPEPMISFPFKTETHVFCETSDAFFAQRKAAVIFERRAPGPRVH